MEFSRPEYWSGWPFPSSGGLSNPGIEPGSPALQADSLPTELSGEGGVCVCVYVFICESQSVMSDSLRPYGL